MANRAFLPYVIGICFIDQILQNPRKIEGSYDDFQSKQNQNPKADICYWLGNNNKIKEMFTKAELIWLSWALVAC